MAYIKFPLLAGVFKDKSPLKAKGYFIDSDKARCSADTMESMKGYERTTVTTFLGACRALWSWTDNGGLNSTFLGTHLRQYAYQDAALYDITAAVSRGQLTNPFTTDGTTAVISVAHTAHGLIANQAVSWPTTTAIKGATITTTTLYAVTITDANTYTFVADTVSTSVGAGVGGTVDYVYYLAPGLQDSAGGAGYGTGGYGSGGYGSNNSGTLFCQTYSARNWGEEILFAPRQGSIYSFNPTGDGYVAAPTEKTTNGSFSGNDTGWTKGAGWAYGVNNEVATASSAALSQSVTLRAASYYLLTFVITSTGGGSLQPSWNGVNIGSAITVDGTYKLMFYSSGGGAQSLAFTGTGYSATLASVSIKQTQHATIIANAPTKNNCMVVTPERIVMVGGTNDSNGNYDNLLLKWSDIGNYTTWTATSANQAGSYQLAEGSKIVRILVGRQELLVFTDTALYVGRYTADPSIVYGFTCIGRNCGLAGYNAAVATDFGVFWMAPGGQFYIYRGGPPLPLDLPVRGYMFDNLTWVQNDKIVAFSNAARHEIGFLWSDIRDPGVEISRYFLYNFDEDKCAIGTYVRTFWLDRGIEQYPLATDASGQLWYMEKEFSADGGALVGFVQTAYFDAGDGDTLSLISGLITDVADLQGGYSITIFGRNSPNDTPTIYGPYSMNAASGQRSLRIRKREISIKFSWNSAPFFFRLGAVRLDVEQTGIRRVRAA